jgi:hypothetical protein
MALGIVKSPHEYYGDPTKGRPVFSGSIYIGLPDLDPEILGNQKQVTLRQEDGTEVPVSQPLLTGPGGYVLYNGSPVDVLVDGNYSQKVLDKGGSQVFYIENAFEGSPVTLESAAIPIVFNTVTDAKAGISADGSTVNLAIGQRIITNENSTGKGGGAPYLVAANQAVDDQGDHLLDNGNVALIQNGSEISIKQFGAYDSAADNLAALDAAVIAADAANLPIDLEGLQGAVSALWHVNLPVNVLANGAVLTGGDADGVVWYGYRTGPDQNRYFISTVFRDIKCVATTVGGTGFQLSKAINCTLKNIVGDGSVGDGINIKGAVGCQFENVRTSTAGFNGVIFTYFTNSDTTTHVPTTACTIINITSESNGVDVGATALNSFGVLCDKDPNGRAAAYGNQFFGGFVQLNQFGGIRDYGQNEWTLWIESNGKNAAAAQQYNFWDSGPKGSIIKAGRNQGAGTIRKLYVDGAVDAPVTKNVHFEGTLQTDIQYETTIAGTMTGSDTASTLVDSTKAWLPDALIGKAVTNSTDGSTGTITDNDEQTFVCVLSGGTDDSWDTGDVYAIADAGPTNIVQEQNEYSGSSPEITPAAYDQRNTAIGIKRKNTFLGLQEDKFSSLDLDANTSGSNQFYSVGAVLSGEAGLLSVTVHINGSPLTLLGQVVEHHSVMTGIIYYIRFTTLNTERYSSSTGDSNTADIPVIRVTAAGDIQYKHNNNSSAQLVQVKFLRLGQ